MQVLSIDEKIQEYCARWTEAVAFLQVAAAPSLLPWCRIPTVRASLPFPSSRPYSPSLFHSLNSFFTPEISCLKIVLEIYLRFLFIGCI